MPFKSIQDAIETFQSMKAKLDRLKQDFDDLKREYEILTGKLRPGSSFVRDLIYRQVLDETYLVPGGGGVTTPPPFDTDPDLKLANYSLSGRIVDGSDGDFVQYAGTSLSIFGVAIAIRRELRTNPLRLDSRIVLTNFHATQKSVQVKVWRHIGLA